MGKGLITQELQPLEHVPKNQVKNRKYIKTRVSKRSG